MRHTRPVDTPIPRLRFLYPLLFGILPVITLLAHNIDDTPLLHAVRPAIVSLLLFFSYGHVYYGLVTEGTLGLSLGVGLVGNHAKLALAWSLLFAVGAFAAYRVRTLRPVMTQLFSTMGLVLVVWPLVQIAAHEVQLPRPWPPAEQEPLGSGAGAAVSPGI